MWLNKPRSVKRLVRLLSHLANRASENEKHDQTALFTNLICLGFTSEVHGLSIVNAVQHADEFTSSERLQSALLHANNDCCDLASFLMDRCPDMISRVFGHVPSTLVDNLVRTAALEAQNGLIFFWSGHGSQPHGALCCAMSENSFVQDRVPVERVFSAVGKTPLLLVMECCHSGAAVRLARDYPNVMVLASTGDGVSGGWVLDGIDSGMSQYNH